MVQWVLNDCGRKGVLLGHLNLLRIQATAVIAVRTPDHPPEAMVARGRSIQLRSFNESRVASTLDTLFCIYLILILLFHKLLWD